MLSMDGLPEVHDRHRRTIKDQPSFWLVSKGLQLLQEYYDAFTVRMTVMPDTAPLLFDSVMFLLQQGACDVVVVPAFGIEWTPEKSKVYWQQIRKIIEHFRSPRDQESPPPTRRISPIQDFEQVQGLVEKRVERRDESSVQENLESYSGCFAGVTNVAVTSSGEIFPCSPFLGSKELRESYRLGTVQEGLDNFRRQELYVLNRSRGLKCRQCRLRSFCLGVCMVANHHATGYLIEPDPMACRKTGFNVSLAKRQVHEACLAGRSISLGGGRESNEGWNDSDLLGS